MAEGIKVQGVSRMADNERALLISLSGRPDDGQVRGLHEFLRHWNRRPSPVAREGDVERAAKAIFDKRKGAFGTALIERGEIELARDLEALRAAIAALSQPSAEDDHVD